MDEVLLPGRALGPALLTGDQIRTATSGYVWEGAPNNRRFLLQGSMVIRWAPGSDPTFLRVFHPLPNLPAPLWLRDWHAGADFNGYPMAAAPGGGVVVADDSSYRFLALLNG